jgi:hypothetical protein
MMFSTLGNLNLDFATLIPIWKTFKQIPCVKSKEFFIIKNSKIKKER